MHEFYVYNEYTYTSSVHFRVTSHPECTHIVGSSKAQHVLVNACAECSSYVSAVRDLQHERSGRVADKARGEAECFISHKNTPRVL